MMSRAILFLGPCLVRLFDRAGSVLVLVAPNIARPVELSDSLVPYLCYVGIASRYRRARES